MILFDMVGPCASCVPLAVAGQKWKHTGMFLLRKQEYCDAGHR